MTRHWCWCRTGGRFSRETQRQTWETINIEKISNEMMRGNHGLDLFLSTNDHVTLARKLNRNVCPTVCMAFEWALGLIRQLSFSIVSSPNSQESFNTCRSVRKLVSSTVEDSWLYTGVSEDWRDNLSYALASTPFSPPHPNPPKTNSFLFSERILYQPNPRSQWIKSMKFIWSKRFEFAIVISALGEG